MQCFVNVALYVSKWYCYRSMFFQGILQQPGDFLKISVPAIIYMVQTNLIYVALSNLDAAFFQVPIPLLCLVFTFYLH